MSMHRWFILVFIIGVGAHSLFLSDTVIQSSLRLEEKSFFAEEFKCSHNVTGLRTLLRFDFVVGNNDTVTFHTNGSLAVEYALHKDTHVLKTGAIEIDCVRDTICAHPMYYTCAPHSLSSQCYARQPWFAECQWIDITGIRERQFDIAFTFENQTYIVHVDLDTVEYISHTNIVKVILIAAVMLWIGLATVLIPRIYYKTD